MNENIFLQVGEDGSSSLNEAECGCNIATTIPNEDTGELVYTVEQCDMHKAAPELLERAEAMVDALDNRKFGDRGEDDLRAYLNLSVTIRKAKGLPDKPESKFGLKGPAIELHRVLTNMFGMFDDSMFIWGEDDEEMVERIVDSARAILTEIGERR